MTERKREIARLYAQGVPRREIAFRLNVTPSNVTKALEDVRAYEADCEALGERIASW